MSLSPGGQDLASLSSLDDPLRRREASIIDVAIAADERRIPGPRPESERGQEIPLH